MSPQRALVALEGLLIATHAMVTACEEKAYLDCKYGLIAETPVPSPLELRRQFVSENEPMLYIADCPTSDEQRRPPLFLNKRSCRRSSDAMTLWRSQIDAHCVCEQGPHMMSRPGPKSGTRSSKCSRSLDQNNTCSSWCEGWVPKRRVRGKPTTRYAVNFTRAEALR